MQTRCNLQVQKFFHLWAKQNTHCGHRLTHFIAKFMRNVETISSLRLSARRFLTSARELKYYTQNEFRGHRAPFPDWKQRIRHGEDARCVFPTVSIAATKPHSQID